MHWKLLSLSSKGLLCLQKGLPGVPQGVACGAVAWILAQTFWGLAAPISAATVVKASSSLYAQSSRAVARHFFGVVAARSPSADAVESPSSRAIDTRWRLIGTYVVSTANSRAVLGAEGSSEVVVAKVGDRLPSGHEVVEVLPDIVVLSKDAQRGELALRSQARGEAEREFSDSRFGVPAPPPFIKDSR